MDAQPVPDLTEPARPPVVSRGRAVPYTGAPPDASELSDFIAAAVDDRCNHIRLDIPWSRVQPTARSVDGAVVETLQVAAQQASDAGLAVWCRLLQPEIPHWFENDGGFSDDKCVATWWPRWVDVAAELMGDHVDGWVPFEAPFGIVTRLEPDDARRQGEAMQRLVVAWRDAWRLLRGPQPVATSIDLAIDRGITDEARRRDLLRWSPWIGAIRDGVVRVPGRGERTLDDLVHSCDQFGIALAADERTERDLDDLLTRVAEHRLGRPIAITLRAVGTSDAQRRESLERIEQRLTPLAAEAELQRLTLIG